MAKVKEQVLVGVGMVYVAPVGEAIPNDFDTPAGNWASIGYTDGGVTQEYNTDQQDIEVDQELDPIDTIITKRTSTLATTMAQLNAENLKRAYGGGTITAVDPDGVPASGDEYNEYVPPAVGDDETIALLFDGIDEDDTPVRVIVPEAKREGGSTIQFRKGEKASISVTWRALVPSQGDEATPVTTRPVTIRIKELPVAGA